MDAPSIRATEPKAKLPGLNLRNRLGGLLLGTAVGDALGLPAEGLSRHRIERWWPGPWQHRFLFGRGMCSDDTEHSIFVAQALLSHPTDAAAFQRSLAWALRWWMLGLPAGIGFATLRAILRLWCGFGPDRSGVFAAGNAPAMRSAVIGAFFARQPEELRRFVRSSTRLTHTDPKAETAALAVAEAAGWIVAQDGDPGGFLNDLRRQAAEPEWSRLVEAIDASLEAKASTPEFAARLGLERGVSGYCYHSVPVALYAWLRHPQDFRAAVESALNCGGDTDTVGAITGALSGATVGISRNPFGMADPPC